MSIMNSITGLTTIWLTSLESYGEDDFRNNYETYQRLVDDYGQEVVDEMEITTLEL